MRQGDEAGIIDMTNKKTSNIKKAMFVGIYTIYPLLLSVIYTLYNKNMYYEGNSFYHYTDNNFILYGILALCYALPFCGFYYFAKKRPFNQWLLCVGFLLVPVFPFIYEYFKPPGKFQYMAAVISMIFYAVPFVTLSLIFAHIISIKDRSAE